MAKKKSKKKAQPAKKLITGTVQVAELLEPAESTSPLWVDRTAVFVRTDGVSLLVFEAAEPDHNRRREVARLTMTNNHARAMLDVMARSLNHYPKPTKKRRDM